MSDFKAKMHQFAVHWGSAPDPAGGAYSALPHPQLYLRGLLLKGGKREQVEGCIWLTQKFWRGAPMTRPLKTWWLRPCRYIDFCLTDQFLVVLHIGLGSLLPYF